MQLQALIDPLKEITRETGELILSYYKSGDFEALQKDDNTPVTTVDIAASELLTHRLLHLTPGTPVLSEEAIQPWKKRRHWRRYWLVDPLDGTQEFIAGSGDFAVSIALVEDGVPTLGMIGWPTMGSLYYAYQGGGAFKEAEGYIQPLRVRMLADPEHGPITVALSRRQPESRVLSRLGTDRPVTILYTGSCALKSALVAEGKADVFLRIGPTGEWDTGAAQVLVQEAGGVLLDEHFQPLSYNLTQHVGNPNFIVLGDPKVNWPGVFPRPSKNDL
ncbi:3'(2'),5'-bisphosphate nucleotidase CysQ [Aliidiomarina halalkaliphila]|uniref:3'(2'),5'-bisphosphate nucleotidase CysQ n=1 Tax=Aliidiomarina halalkaliphila TaxID=2593535 RepID=A0A552X1W8_9GAMM|nr:3'(2'),5'-bisphosphate nucleotidase CysQ [Aliidiomarina halalkaliphila]TRW49032.1 3'(2'),5'-bisphosphate nucleotidase CysQ [Aliidiomarina halalkaliphila]